MGNRLYSERLVANDTDEDVTVKIRVDFGGYQIPLFAHKSMRYPIRRSLCTRNVYIEVYTNQSMVVQDSRKVFDTDNGFVIKKKGTKYVLYQSMLENVWEIDKDDEENKERGF